MRITARTPILSHLFIISLPKTPKSNYAFTSLERFSPFYSQNSKRFSFFFFQKPPMPPRHPPPPSSSTKIAVEYAKSNKSTCKKCANAIAMKSLRLGIVSPDARGFDVTKWHHLDCFPIGSAPVGSAEEINGFQELKSSDQEALKELLDRCEKSSEKVHERDEDEGNEREESDSKKSKVDDPPPSSSTKIAVEYAKSNKSMCKKCAKAITFKALRLGIVSRDARGFDVTKWHHLDCFPIGSASVGSAEEIDGFQALKSSDQEALKELLDRCDESSIKVHERDEDKGNEREESDSKKAKVDDPPPSSSTKIAVEYAKSNKSMCKKCAKAITFKALRLGIVSRDARGFDVTKWHHLDCFPIGSVPVGSAEAINGFQALKSSDQEALKELLDRCDESSVKLSTSDGEAEIDVAFSVSDVENKYKDATLLPKWKRFNTIIFLERDDGLHDSNKIAAFDFDGCLAKTSVKKVGADAWSLMYLSIPDKLQNLYNDGYKLVIFTNESNIERWKNKRQAAVDSKIGRLNNFIKLVKVPIQVFIACGLGESSSRAADPFRKPKPGMWHIMEKHFNSGISIDMDQSFYVGDAAGRDNDHSDADIKFAQAVGLKFYVPEEYFGA